VVYDLNDSKTVEIIKGFIILTTHPANSPRHTLVNGNMTGYRKCQLYETAKFENISRMGKHGWVGWPTTFLKFIQDHYQHYDNFKVLDSTNIRLLGCYLTEATWQINLTKKLKCFTVCVTLRDKVNFIRNYTSLQRLHLIVRFPPLSSVNQNGL